MILKNIIKQAKHPPPTEKKPKTKKNKNKEI